MTLQLCEVWRLGRVAYVDALELQNRLADERGQGVSASLDRLLLLEHPTKDLTDDAARTDVGRTLRRVAEARPVGWLAFADDPVFAKQSAGERWRLDLATGEMARHRWWR